MSLPEGAKARLGKGIIKDILYSPDGKMFVVVSSIGHWIYDTKNYQEIALLPIPKSSDRPLTHRIQNTNYSVDGQMLISETEENQVIIWDVATKEIKDLGLVNSTSFSTGRKTLTIYIEEKPIELWYGKKEITVKPKKEYDEIDIISVYSPDGKATATTIDGYNIKIKDTRTPTKSRFHIKFPKFKYGQEIYISPDRKTLATLFKDLPILLWDVNKDKLKITLVGHLVKNNPIQIQSGYHLPSQIDSIAFSPNGKLLANGSLTGEIRLWNINSGRLIRKLTDQYGFIKSLSFSPDGELLASGSDDGSILVWDIETGRYEPFLAERMRGISCLSFSSDGKMLLGGSVNGDIHLFDVETRNTLRTFTGHIAEISHLMFSPDDSKIASIGWDGSIRLWDIESAKQLKTMSMPISGHFRGYWREIWFADDGDLFAINLDYNHFIHLWNVSAGKYMQSLKGHASHLSCFSISADGQTLASSSADGTILLWDLKSVFDTIH